MQKRAPDQLSSVQRGHADHAGRLSNVEVPSRVARILIVAKPATIEDVRQQDRCAATPLKPVAKSNDNHADPGDQPRGLASRSIECLG